MIQHHPDEFLKQFKTLFISRRLFELMKRQDDECLTDIHRAVKWFYILKSAFGGHMVNANFGYGTTDRSRLNILDLEETILQIHWRLAKVYLENEPYERVIARYDRPHTFFYLDPPYYGYKVYRHNFEPADFEALSGLLGRLKGKFIVSLNDHPEVRRIFRTFRIRQVRVKYSANHPSTGRAEGRRELLITNY